MNKVCGQPKRAKAPKFSKKYDPMWPISIPNLRIYTWKLILRCNKKFHVDIAKPKAVFTKGLQRSHYVPRCFNIM